MISVFKVGDLVKSSENPSFIYRVVKRGVLRVDLVEVNYPDYVYDNIRTSILTKV